MASSHQRNSSIACVVKTSTAFQESFLDRSLYTCLKNSFPGVTAQAVDTQRPAVLAKTRAVAFPFDRTFRSCRLIRVTHVLYALKTGNSPEVSIWYPICEIEVVGSKTDFSRLMWKPRSSKVSKTRSVWSVISDLRAQIKKSSTYTATLTPRDLKYVIIGLIHL